MESNSSAESLEGQLQSGGKEPKYLIENANRLVPWRDFSTEIRADLDTRNLASKCCVLLDVQDLDLRAIVRKMVDAFNQQMDLAEALLYAKVTEQIFNAGASGDIGPNLKCRLQNLICDEMGLLEDQSWFVLYCSLDDISENRVAFVRLQHRTNFGPGLGDVQFIILVIAPVQQKEIKSAFETSRTFATLFSCPQLRFQLAQTANKVQFCAAIEQSAVNLIQRPKYSTKNGFDKVDLGLSSSLKRDSECWRPGKAILEDLKRRWPHYKADYWDGLCDARAIQKTISSAVFLFFAILLTAIALGVLNESNTHGKIKVEEAILGNGLEACSSAFSEDNFFGHVDLSTYEHIHTSDGRSECADWLQLLPHVCCYRHLVFHLPGPICLFRARLAHEIC
uniref:Bicarbonate transporter-like transmembrane domain-containing protein n=1 Tax=Ditylenchus dipsaci TaxID=166011 RepID=A0A915CVE5_9BILA